VAVAVAVAVTSGHETAVVTVVGAAGGRHDRHEGKNEEGRNEGLLVHGRNSVGGLFARR